MLLTSSDTALRSRGLTADRWLALMKSATRNYTPICGDLIFCRTPKKLPAIINEFAQQIEEIGLNPFKGF